MSGPSAERDAAPCGVAFRHDWHGFLDDDGRTRVCDGEIGPRHNHNSTGDYPNCPACGTVLPPEVGAP